MVKAASGGVGVVYVAEYASDNSAVGGEVVCVSVAESESVYGGGAEGYKAEAVGDAGS